MIAAANPLDVPSKILPVNAPPLTSMLASGWLLPGFCTQIEQLPPSISPPVTFTVFLCVVLLAN